MYYKKLIDDLLHELSYRSTEGYPILSKKEHQSIISEILTEWGDFGAKEIIMEFLTEGPKVQEADETGYTHIGAGVYVRSGDVTPDGTAKPGAQKYSQDESGRFSPISEDDYETMKSSQGEEGEDAAAAQNAQTAAQAGGGEAGVDGGEGGGQQEEPQTGTSLKDPSYQDGVKREQEVQAQIAAEKTGGTEKVSPSEEEQKLKTEDSTKVKKQILMTADEAKKQQKGVGLGTPESRTGESVTVYAGQKIQELMQSGMTYEQARVELENELLAIARDKNYILTEDWVKSGLAVFDHLNDVYGFENVKHFAWDTPQGNKLVGATDHGTSADMFVQLQDGTTIGVSLKKGFKVFIVNGGYAKAMKEFEEKTGISFSENCQIDHYMSRRDSMLSNSINTINGNKEFFKQTIDGFLSNPDEFEKTFGKKAAKNRKSFLVAKKLGISIAKAKAMSDEERDSVMQTVTSDDVISYMTDVSDTSNDRMKFMSGVFKIKDVDSKFGIYKELRGLDNEMTENMFQDIKSNSEKEQKLKEKIVEDTHIIDTLFPNKPLGDFKTIFGEKPAVEMTRAAIVSIFGIDELWKQYNAAKTDEEKQEIRKQIEREITSKLKIDKKNGVPVISISVKNEDGSESDLPLYKLGVRTRGIGDSPTLEIAQATFGSLALKNGNTNINSWSNKDKQTVVNGEVDDILSSFEDSDNPDINDLTAEELQEIKDRIKLLESYGSNSKKLKDLKKKLGIQ
jgi:hypothetical protein